MAAKMSGDADSLITDINVTPFVDIILVLLIIFMLTANLISRQAIQVDLPKAATGEPSEPTTLAITVKKEGTIYLNGEEITDAALREQLPEVAKKDPKAQAIIGADKEVSHGQVVYIIDLVRQLGIYKFAINIDPVAAASYGSEAKKAAGTP